MASGVDSSQLLTFELFLVEEESSLLELWSPVFIKELKLKIRAYKYWEHLSNSHIFW